MIYEGFYCQHLPKSMSNRHNRQVLSIFIFHHILHWVSSDIYTHFINMSKKLINVNGSSTVVSTVTYNNALLLKNFHLWYTMIIKSTHCDINVFDIWLKNQLIKNTLSYKIMYGYMLYHNNPSCCCRKFNWPKIIKYRITFI